MLRGRPPKSEKSEKRNNKFKAPQRTMDNGTMVNRDIKTTMMIDCQNVNELFDALAEIIQLK